MKKHVQRQGDCPPHSLQHHPIPAGSTSLSLNHSNLLNDAIPSSRLPQSETGRDRAVRERSSPRTRQRPRREDVVFPYLVSSIRIVRRSTTPSRYIVLYRNYLRLSRGTLPSSRCTAPAFPGPTDTLPARTRCSDQVGAAHHQTAHR